MHHCKVTPFPLSLSPERPESPFYPFSAVVGQEKMKLALLLNLIHPGIGGLLIRGHRGTAKSTAVRGLLNLLSPIQVVKDCPFGCHPEDPELMCDGCLQRWMSGQALEGIESPSRLINLPLGATEDRLLGTLDFEVALQKGERRFEPGLLAQANRGLLYVDEVNLLSDHLVDLLLDVAAMKVNYVEREGISFRHPSRFVLIGSMNPQEGDLRPQLLDRFGLCVDVKGSENLAERVEIARRRIAYESNPKGFVRQWAGREEELAHRLVQARDCLEQVIIPDRIWESAARLSLSFKIEGHRSDLTMIKTAQALCAFRALEKVSIRELVEAAELTLPHRYKAQNLGAKELDPKKIQELLKDIDEEEPVSSATGPAEEKKNRNTL